MRDGAGNHLWPERGLWLLGLTIAGVIVGMGFLLHWYT